MKKDDESLSAVSSRSQYACFSSQKQSYPAAVSAYSYLHGQGVHNVHHEAVHRNPHKAHLGHPLVQAHTALPDLVLHKRHKDLLVAVLHQRMELRGDAHRDHRLPRMEHVVVDFLLLDSPTVMDTLFTSLHLSGSYM